MTQQFQYDITAPGYTAKAMDAETALDLMEKNGKDKPEKQHERRREFLGWASQNKKEGRSTNVTVGTTTFHVRVAVHTPSREYDQMN